MARPDRPVRLQVLLKRYSPECLEGEFCELRIDGVLGGSQQQVMCLSNSKNHSFGGCEGQQVLATLIALLKCEQPAGESGTEGEAPWEAPRASLPRTRSRAERAGLPVQKRPRRRSSTTSRRLAPTTSGPPGSLAQRGSPDRAADGNARRDDFLLRGVLAPLPFGSALGKTQ